MATIDTSLFPSATFKVDSGEAMPVNSRLNALRESQMKDISFRQAQQQEADNMLIQQAYNAPDPVNFLAQQGRGDLAIGVQDAQAKRQAAQLEQQSGQLAHQSKVRDFINQGLLAITNDPSDEHIMQWGNQAVSGGYLPADAVRNSVQGLLSVPVDKRADYIRSLGMTAQQQYEANKPAAPKEYAPTELEKLLSLRSKYALGTPERDALEAKIKLETTRAPGTTVNVSTAGPKAEQEAKGKSNVAVADEIRLAGNEARKQLANTDLMEKLLDEGLRTGFATETQAKIANALTKLGVENAAQYATNAQAFQAFVRQNVLNEQKQQKGVQTEGDAQRIEETFARLGNTPDANKFLLATKRAVNNQAIRQHKFWSDWWTKNKTYEGVEDAWLNGEGSKSIFDSPELKKYAAKKSLDEIFKKKTP